MISAIQRRIVGVCTVGCLVMAGWLGTSQLVAAQTENEYVLRAAYVFNLAKYVDWPPVPKQITVCFLGEGPMGEALKKVLEGKTIGPRDIGVKLQPSDDAVGSCQVLYVGRLPARRLHDILEHLRGQSSLTIGESDGFAHEGGSVGLVRMGDQFQIQINIGVVEAAGLKISSRLLNLSSVVCIDRKH